MGRIARRLHFFPRNVVRTILRRIFGHLSRRLTRNSQIALSNLKAFDISLGYRKTTSRTLFSGGGVGNTRVIFTPYHGLGRAFTSVRCGVAPQVFWYRKACVVRLFGSGTCRGRLRGYATMRHPRR